MYTYIRYIFIKSWFMASKQLKLFCKISSKKMISFRGSNSYYVQPTTFSNTKWIKCGLHEQFWWLFGKYCLLSNRNRRFISVSRAETCHTLSYSVPFWLLMTTWTSLIESSPDSGFYVHLICLAMVWCCYFLIIYFLKLDITWSLSVCF